MFYTDLKEKFSSQQINNVLVRMENVQNTSEEYKNEIRIILQSILEV